MSYSISLRAALGTAFVLFLAIATADAQQRFTYVSRSSGSDANSCFSPAGACLTLQRAHNQTLPGGTVFVLESGALASEQVVITKSIGIVAVGATHYVVDGGNSPIIVNAGPDDVVILDGVRAKSFPGYSPSSYGGIRFVAGGRLHIRNCAVERFEKGAGIHIVAPGPSQVEISDCVLSDNRDGIQVQSAGGGNVQVLVDGVTLAGNTRDGIRAAGNNTVVRVNDSAIVNNKRGIRARNGGKIITSGNNVLRANGTNGAFTSKNALK